MRVGKAWKHINTVGLVAPVKSLIREEHLVELVPVRPKGWVIFIDKKLAYAGIVFSKRTGLECIETKMKRVQQKQKMFGLDVASFEELPQQAPPEMDPPPGTMISMISKLPDETTDETKKEEVALIPAATLVYHRSELGIDPEDLPIKEGEVQ